MAKGYAKVAGLDFEETFAPVAIVAFHAADAAAGIEVAAETFRQDVG